MNIYKFCNKNYLKFFYFYLQNLVNTFAFGNMVRVPSSKWYIYIYYLLIYIKILLIN